MRYPPLRDTFLCITHPFATRSWSKPHDPVRLACVKHSASVQSEPGSNSSVQCLFDRSPYRSHSKLLTRLKLLVSTSLCLKLRARRLAPGHQAPTLIDCIFLKNVAVATNPSCKQQRSGILQLSEVSCKPLVSQFRFRAIKEGPNCIGTRSAAQGNLEKFRDRP